MQLKIRCIWIGATTSALKFTIQDSVDLPYLKHQGSATPAATLTVILFLTTEHIHAIGQHFKIIGLEGVRQHQNNSAAIPARCASGFIGMPSTRATAQQNFIELIVKILLAANAIGIGRGQCWEISDFQSSIAPSTRIAATAATSIVCVAATAAVARPTTSKRKIHWNGNNPFSFFSCQSGYLWVKILLFSKYPRNVICLHIPAPKAFATNINIARKGQLIFYIQGQHSANSAIPRQARDAANHS